MYYYRNEHESLGIKGRSIHKNQKLLAVNGAAYICHQGEFERPHRVLLGDNTMRSHRCLEALMVEGAHFFETSVPVYQVQHNTSPP